MSVRGARQGRQRSDRRIGARLITPRHEGAALCAVLVSLLKNEGEMRVNRPKLEKRRQTLIHLGFGSSQGGLDAANGDDAEAHASEFILGAVIPA